MGNCQVLQPVNNGYNPLNDVVHRNGTTEGPGRDPIPIHKTFVHKKAGGSTVKESHEGYELLGVRGDYLKP